MFKPLRVKYPWLRARQRIPMREKIWVDGFTVLFRWDESGISLGIFSFPAPQWHQAAGGRRESAAGAFGSLIKMVLLLAEHTLTYRLLWKHLIRMYMHDFTHLKVLAHMWLLHTYQKTDYFEPGSGINAHNVCACSDLDSHFTRWCIIKECIYIQGEGRHH